MNVGFTGRAQNALNRAISAACEMGHTCVGTEHILLGLLEEGEGIASRVLSEKGITADSLRRMIEETSGVGERTRLSAADMTPRTKKVIENSASLAVNMGHGFIGTEHLLLAITGEPDCFAVKMLERLGASPDELRRDVASYLGADPESVSQGGRGGRETGEIKNCPVLSQHGRDLCRLAKEGKIDPIIGRDEETERVIQILSRRTKNNPCLIGEPGVGKTAVVEGLAQRIVDGNVPDDLRNKSIVTLDISSMVAGAKYRGEFEERMKSVMKEVLENRNIILFIDEIHTIIGAGGAEGAVDAANIIKPALARGEMQVIGATTIDEYRRHIEKDAALERRFQSVMVGEPTPEEAEKILFGLRDKYEAHHKLKISDEA
ncbi:MAG: ATP-dependent Clp protease ATP-binding subunit, partial [Clostridia bacterium]|nr:ATP-dependent Clp protease ATP-binding subunit [Clostridia bacterium]